MDTVDLLLTMIGLLFALVGLVFLYILFSRPKAVAIEQTNLPLTLDQLDGLLHNATTSNHTLHNTANDILKRFMAISDIGRYRGFIEAICTHPNTDSKLISDFEKRLRDGNPKYKEEIRKALKEGLAKRDKK